jgi:two-component system, cell cycle response regulator
MEGAAMKILLCDDDKVALRMMEKFVRRWGFNPLTASDGEEALDALNQPDGPKIAILDWMMPKLDGTEVCARLRASQREDYVYVLLLTSRSGRDDVAAGLDAGADDYLVKPFDPSELRARLGVAERVVGFSQGLLSANSMLRTAAMTDKLTGLLNHGAVKGRLEEEIARHARTDVPLGVLMCDIDHFKTFNDTHGHAAGDAVLRVVAAAIRGACRPYDVVGRYGGEEFLVLLPATGHVQMALVAERVRANVAACLVRYGDMDLHVTVSVGASCLESGKTEPAERLLKEADDALYDAKHRGRNRVCEAVAVG